MVGLNRILGREVLERSSKAPNEYAFRNFAETKSGHSFTDLVLSFRRKAREEHQESQDATRKVHHEVDFWFRTFRVEPHKQPVVLDEFLFEQADLIHDVV